MLPAKLTSDPRWATSMALQPLTVPESVGQGLLPAEALPPRTSPTNRTNLFPLAIKLCFVIGFLEAPGFPPFRHLDAILERSPEGKSQQLREEGSEVAQQQQGVPRGPHAERTYVAMFQPDHPSNLLCVGPPHRHPPPHSRLYLAPRLTWAKLPCCSCIRCIPPGYQSPSGLKGPSCYPVSGQDGGQGRKRCQWKRNVSPLIKARLSQNPRFYHSQILP